MHRANQGSPTKEHRNDVSEASLHNFNCNWSPPLPKNITEEAAKETGLAVHLWNSCSLGDAIASPRDLGDVVLSYGQPPHRRLREVFSPPTDPPTESASLSCFPRRRQYHICSSRVNEPRERETMADAAVDR